ncbi:DNA mismatch repair protein MutT [Amycolatopsis antarctica]|uniref:8-oxo-dGTP diphosphatase n=1 Tax=Amycolatopsis antarctica TaxID=1854586 RepID=A0A263D6L0_9PSEU|nr:NUDIX domain-containing protein [Amycolatopsis antarctica]OZM73668.1 DNA mismatch repair protein MutT [Amycolatopsis antarctica]
MVIVGAAIVRSGLLLAQQRSFPEDAAGKWELPGGRVEPGESEVDALARECHEELAVRIEVADRVGADVDLPRAKVLRIYAATLADPRAEPRPVEHAAVRWVPADGIDALDWLPADRVLLPALHALLLAA